MGVHRNSAVWHKISLEWAKWFAAELRQQNIKDIIFCGDFFHDRDSVAVDTIQAAHAVLRELQEFNILMFPGNHDCFFKQHAEINSLSILDGWSNIKVLHKCSSITIGEQCTACLCPWGTTIEELPPCDVTFGHFEIQTFKMNTFKMCEQGISIRQILEKSPLIFSGHFHFREERSFEIGKIVYVGNPFQMDLNDAGNQKGYYIFDGDTKAFEFIENNISPEVIRLRLSQICDEEVEPEELFSSIHGNIVQFIIDEKLAQEDSIFLKKKLSSFKPLQIDFFDDSLEINTAGEQRAFEGIDNETAIIEYIEMLNPPNKAALQEYLVNLYRKFK